MKVNLRNTENTFGNIQEEDSDDINSQDSDSLKYGYINSNIYQ